MEYTKKYVAGLEHDIYQLKIENAALSEALDDLAKALASNEDWTLSTICGLITLHPVADGFALNAPNPCWR